MWRTPASRTRQLYPGRLVSCFLSERELLAGAARTAGDLAVRVRDLPLGLGAVEGHGADGGAGRRQEAARVREHRRLGWRGAGCTLYSTRGDSRNFIGMPKFWPSRPGGPEHDMHENLVKRELS